MAVSVADCCHRSKLNCSAAVPMSSSMFDEEEGQKEIRQTDSKGDIQCVRIGTDRVSVNSVKLFVSSGLVLNLPSAD
jgi:hypothetical protein